MYKIYMKNNLCAYKGSIDKVSNHEGLIPSRLIFLEKIEFFKIPLFWRWVYKYNLNYLITHNVKSFHAYIFRTRGLFVLMQLCMK